MSTCLTYLRALRAHLLSVLACLHAFDSYMPSFLRALRVFFFLRVLCVFILLRALDIFNF